MELNPQTAALIGEGGVLFLAAFIADVKLTNQRRIPSRGIGFEDGQSESQPAYYD